MNAQEKNELIWLRSRSSSAVIKKGYRFYLNNFRKLFKASWSVALLYAIVVGVSMSLFINHFTQYIILSQSGLAGTPEVQQQFYVFLAIVGGIGLLFLLIAVLFTSCGITLLDEYRSSGITTMPTRWYGRLSRPHVLLTLKAVLWLLLIIIVFAGIIVGCAFVWKVWLGNITGIVFFICMNALLLVMWLPFSYIIFNYMFDGHISFPSLLSRRFGVAIRHWGSIFIVALVTGILVMLFTIITELPANILYIANLQSQIGMLQGDPQGMPTYMTWMNLIVFAIAGFIQAYVHLSTLFPYFFLYGSLEAQEEEREELNRQSAP